LGAWELEQELELGLELELSQAPARYNDVVV